MLELITIFVKKNIIGPFIALLKAIYELILKFIPPPKHKIFNIILIIILFTIISFLFVVNDSKKNCENIIFPKIYNIDGYYTAIYNLGSEEVKCIALKITILSFEENRLKIKCRISTDKPFETKTINGSYNWDKSDIFINEFGAGKVFMNQRGKLILSFIKSGKELKFVQN